MNFGGITGKIRSRAAQLADRVRLNLSIRHRHGPKRLDAAADDVIVVALIRDGAYYLDAFFDHYRRLGARFFVFFDNGSTDGTLERIAAEPGTVIVQSLLPWGRFENHFRRYAAETYCAGHWCLYADMDEMFDFDGSDRIGLPDLARHLAAQGYSALMAQMLEMFPDRPVQAVASLDYREVQNQFRFYDLSAIEDVDYHSEGLIHFGWWMRNNTLSNPEIRFLFGGVRNKVFGELCCLTKHPLVFVGKGVLPGVHPHCSANVHCADFTALIRHYKFANDPQARDARTVAERAIGHGEDRKRLDTFRSNAALTLHSPQARVFDGFGPLYDAGFLVRSSRFAQWLKDRPDAS